MNFSPHPALHLWISGKDVQEPRESVWCCIVSGKNQGAVDIVSQSLPIYFGRLYFIWDRISSSGKRSSSLPAALAFTIACKNSEFRQSSTIEADISWTHKEASWCLFLLQHDATLPLYPRSRPASSRWEPHGMFYPWRQQFSWSFGC